MTNIPPDNDNIPNYYGGDTPLNNSSYQHPQQFQTQPMKPKRNRDGLISFIVSMATLLLLRGIPVVGIAAAIVGIVFGHRSMKQTKGNPLNIRSHGICGTIAGYFSLVASIAFTTIFFIQFAEALAK